VDIENKFDYIWSRDQLRAFLDHSSADVRSWAACRILELFPDLKDEVIDMLPTAPPDVVNFLLDGLCESDADQGKVGPLLQYYQIADRQIDKNKAAALLNRYGYNFPEKDLADLDLPKIADFASTETGFSAILKRSLSSNLGEPELVLNLAYGCGIEDLYELIVSDDSLREKRQSLKDLADHWQCQFPDVLELKDVSSALRLLEDVLSRADTSLSEGPDRFPALTRVLDRDLARCKLIKESLKEHLTGGNKINSSFLPLLQICSLGILRNTTCRILLSGKDLDLAELWRVLTMRWWNTTTIDAGLISFLQNQDPAMVISSLKEVFDCDEDWTFAEYAFRCLEAAGIPGRYELLLDALDYGWGLDIVDDAEEVINGLRPDIIETALGRWKKQLPENLPFWLKMYPVPEVIQFLKDNFLFYFTSSNQRFFLELLGEIASPAFFELLLNEWRPEEPALATHIKTIAELNNLTDQRLGLIIQESEAVEKSLGSLKTESDLTGYLTQKKLHLSLKCTACKRIYRYAIECLYMDDKKEEFIIGDIIQCKGCGSIETYELEESVGDSLNIQLGWFIELHKEGKIDKKDLPFKGFIKGIAAGGREFKSITEAYHYTKQSLERDPQNLDLQIRMAKIFINGNRPDLALPIYKEVFKHKPEDPEVVDAIANILLKQKKYLEAVPLMEKLPAMLRHGTMKNELRSSLLLSLADMADTVQKQIGYRIQNRPPDDLIIGSQAAFRSFEKAGRNDPCPCGSGKKYKKCCGLK
jgi:hypothetical protein